MAEFPALPLWTDAYLGDTTHLTTFEHGAYFLLLVVSWRTAGCRLPDDDALLARYVRTTPDKWRKLKPILAPFFRIRDGFWTQARLQDEHRLLQTRKLQQIEAGHASAKAKSLKRTNRDATDVSAPLQREVNETSTPTPTPTPTVDNADASSTRGRKSAPKIVVPKPDDVTAATWADFEKVRKGKNAPITPTSIAGIRREAEALGWTLERALVECCERNWQGFKAKWITREDNHNGNGNRSNGQSDAGDTIRDPLLRSYLEDRKAMEGGA